MLALALAAAACGDDGDDSAGTGGDTTTDDGGDDGGDDGDGGDPGVELDPNCGELDATPGDPAPTAGFDGSTITVGALATTSGQVSVIGNPLLAGNQAYLDYVNEELGGIAGQYPVELLDVDTGYVRATAVTEYTNTVDDVTMYVQILGTPIVQAVLGDMSDDCVVGAPATLDAAWVRDPNLLPVGGPYQIQAINGVDWYINQGDGSTDDVLCTLASDDEYGDAGVEGVAFVADALGMEVAANVTFPAPGTDRAEQSFTTQRDNLRSEGCEVIFFVATPADANAFSGALAADAAYNPVVIGQSPVWLGLFAANYPDEFYLVSEGPQFGDESVPGMELLTRVREEYAAEVAPDIYFNFGFLQGMATVAVLEKAVEIGDLSRAGIVTAINELGVLSFDGLSGDYTYGPPEDRVPPTSSSIFIANPDNPTALEIVEQDYESSVAADFTFG